MAALVHDRGTTREQGWPGGPRCPVPEGGHPNHHPSHRPAPGRRSSDGRWRAALTMAAVAVLMAVGGVVADVAVGLGGARRPAAVPSAVPSPAVGSVRLVQPGETYWSIAEEVGGGSDLRVRVAALEEANGGRILMAGDRLVILEAQ